MLNNENLTKEQLEEREMMLVAEKMIKKYRRAFEVLGQ